jgi:hypothetical protein
VAYSARHDGALRFHDGRAECAVVAGKPVAGMMASFAARLDELPRPI